MSSYRAIPVVVTANDLVTSMSLDNKARRNTPAIAKVIVEDMDQIYQLLPPPPVHTQEHLRALSFSPSKSNIKK